MVRVAAGGHIEVMQPAESLMTDTPDILSQFSDRLADLAERRAAVLSLSPAAGAGR